MQISATKNRVSVCICVCVGLLKERTIFVYHQINFWYEHTHIHVTFDVQWLIDWFNHECVYLSHAKVIVWSKLLNTSALQQKENENNFTDVILTNK